MEALAPLAALLLNRWSTSFAGLATASLLVWYLGPLVPGMNGALPRACAILALVLLWGAANGALSWRRRRRGHTLDAALTGGTADDSAADVSAEMAALRLRMRAALARLRRTSSGGHLYERPWFVMIGPPGAGKTTALRHSGLHFPLDRDGDAGGGMGGAVGGVGGTRLCDFWFADEAVLIDTAGRYTTQDSDVTVDKAGWLGFLDLLRRARPRQPLNGVIVVVSLADIAAASPEESRTHARAIRRRIDEINERLRLRLPVYVVFSKADRLAGFDAYFDDLDAEARAQVWGMTFGLTDRVEAFAAEFRLLLERLDARLTERLQAERAADRRAQIAGFPLQVASLAAPLSSFLAHAFTGSRIDPAPFLRGVYMTSATQEGTPIDRLTGMLARAFNVDQKRAPSLRPAAGRSYFVSRLLRDVILGEALLASCPPAVARRRRLARLAGFASVGAATVAGGLVLWQADAANGNAIRHADEGLAGYRQQLMGTKLSPVDGDDLARVVPLLDAAQPPHGETSGALQPGFSQAGLSQAGKISQSHLLSYRHALQRILLPRLVWRVEQQIRMHFDDPDFLYQAVRVYLMLGSQGPLDPSLVRSWIQADWAQRFPGALNAALRQDLAVHLDALMADPLPAITLDGGVVQSARATFSRVTLPQRIYSRMAGGSAAQHIPAWSPEIVLGPAGAASFQRLSGLPLSNGVPGLLTATGFHDVLQHDLPATTRAVASESWVLGHAQEMPSSAAALAALEQAVVAVWVADAEAHWDALLCDLALAPFDGRTKAVGALYVLSSPQSPMRDLLAAIAAQLAVSPADADSDPALMEFSARYRALISLTTPASGAAAAPGHPATVLDGVLPLVSQLQQQLALAESGVPAQGAAPPGNGDAAALLLAEAARQPMPLARWLQQIAATGNTSLGSAARSAAATAYASANGPDALCHEVVDGHYPFDAAAAQDAPIDDFARLFAPGGTFDRFFQTQLSPYVDSGHAVWKPQPHGGVEPPVDAAAAAAFQRAAAIRDSLFSTGGTVPAVRFTVAPVQGVSPATLRLGNASVVTGTATGNAVSLIWPGEDGLGSAMLQVADAAVLREDGPWALFRLLDHAGIAAGADAEHLRLNFNVGDARTAFALQTGSARSPFARTLLRGFRCPVL